MNQDCCRDLRKIWRIVCAIAIPYTIFTSINQNNAWALIVAIVLALVALGYLKPGVR